MNAINSFCFHLSILRNFKEKYDRACKVCKFINSGVETRKTIDYVLATHKEDIEKTNHNVKKAEGYIQEWEELFRRIDKDFAFDFGDKNLDDFSLETVKSFYKDSIAAGFKI